LPDTARTQTSKNVHLNRATSKNGDPGLPFVTFASFCSNPLRACSTPLRLKRQKNVQLARATPKNRVPWPPLCYLCFLLFKSSLLPSVAISEPAASAQVHKPDTARATVRSLPAAFLFVVDNRAPGPCRFSPRRNTLPPDDQNTVR
jgi:hypothetical protein